MNALAVEADSLFDQIRGMPDEFLLCRDLRHHWSVPKGFFQVKVEGGVRGALYVEREVACDSCDLKRMELFRVHARWMEKLGRPRYTYPKGYQLRGSQKGEHVTGMIQLELYMREMARVND